MDDDLALEHRARGVVDDALEHLAAAGVGHQVVDAGGVVAVLAAAHQVGAVQVAVGPFAGEPHRDLAARQARSEEHTSELQSLMRISYAVFCLKKKKKPHIQHTPRSTPQNTSNSHNQMNTT